MPRIIKYDLYTFDATNPVWIAQDLVEMRPTRRHNLINQYSPKV